MTSCGKWFESADPSCKSLFVAAANDVVFASQLCLDELIMVVRLLGAVEVFLP